MSTVLKKDYTIAPCLSLHVIGFQVHDHLGNKIPAWARRNEQNPSMGQAKKIGKQLKTKAWEVWLGT